MKKIPFFSDLDEHLLKQIVKNIATKKRSAIVATFAPKMHQVFSELLLGNNRNRRGDKAEKPSFKFKLHFINIKIAIMYTERGYSDEVWGLICS